MITAKMLDRLVEAEIQLLPLTQIENHWVFGRDGFVALVERTKENGVGRIGSPGLLTERGMAVLVERDGHKLFVAKGFEEAASDEQVTLLRSFARDLESALTP